jgi:hypothetical protein
MVEEMAMEINEGERGMASGDGDRNDEKVIFRPQTIKNRYANTSSE